MWKMDSDQKSIPVVGFLTCNDCDVLRTKTGIYRRVTYRTIILPTLAQYHELRDVFSKEAFDKLPPWKAWDPPLTSHLGLNSLAPGHSPCPLQNRRSLMTSSRRTLRMATSVHPSPPWEPLCSSSRRRMVHFASYRTIGS